MYRVIACAACWLILLGSFATAWARIPRPWTETDLIVLAIIGAAAVAFARLGLVSIAALLVRILPSGRIRALLAGAVIRAMPRLLTSSVLAVASTAVVVQAANATPAIGMESTDTSNPTGAEAVAASPVDPSWPTVGEGPSSPDDGARGDEPGSDGESTAQRLRDPGWPTAPPPQGNEDDPDEEVGSGAGGRPGDSPDQERKHVHEVDDGESLWSIAEEIADSAADVPELVNDIYTANRDTIGPDPSLIIAGQRLEIQQ